LNNLFFLTLGLVFLLWGAEWLVRGASRLARALGISPLAIGLTIVAYGTSTPELVVNINSILSGKEDIALGNIVGSNIFNVLFILGVCALILPLRVEAKLIKWDVPIMIFVSGLLYGLCLDYHLSRWEGAALIAGVILYTWFCFAYSKTENKDVQKEYEKEFGGDAAKLRQPGNMAMNIVLVLLGLGILVIGSKWLVNSAVELARHFGISELVIALTIVAAGTSLPEVATSIVATVKGERDIAIGNVVGSNIYNILAILGISGVMTAKGVPINPNSMVLDIPFMVLVAVLCYPIFRSRSTISRVEGAFLFLLYIGYTVYLVQTNH
jgi:cation:H+ antiporter